VDMENKIGKVCAEGLSFFGMSNRLISHELKNILAIISETLGLMNELVELSETGMALDPGKLSALSKSIMEEVERANRIIRNMNTLAHSVDEFIREVDLGQTIDLTMEVCRLDSASRKTQLNLVDTEACTIYTSPLFLKNLLFHVINFSLREPGPEKKIRISIDSTDHGTRMTFSGLASPISGEFPTRKETLLADVLSAEISRDTDAGELHIDLPKRMGKSLIGNLLPVD
jgi:light-regulated signal transduction histidine kinase (bacteriophytochrome)